MRFPADGDVYSAIEVRVRNERALTAGISTFSNAVLGNSRPEPTRCSRFRAVTARIDQ
jgi:hypothetical protein